MDNSDKAQSTCKPWWLAAAPAIFLLLWSGGYVVAKIGLVYSPPMTLLVMRYACVVVLMGLLFIVLKPPLPKTAQDWGHLAFVGFMMQAVYFGFAYLAFINGVAAATVALIMSLQPILVALVAPRWSGEQVSVREWAGLLIALVGTAIVILSRTEIGPASAAGLFFAVTALAGITTATLWEKRFGLSHHPVTSNLIGYLAGLAGVLPLMLCLETPSVDWNWTFAAALAYLVVGNSLIAVGLLLAMIRAGEVSKVTSLLYLVPPLAALIAWLSLGEIMPPLAWIGFVIAGAGVYLATRKKTA